MRLLGPKWDRSEWSASDAALCPAINLRPPIQKLLVGLTANNFASCNTMLASGSTGVQKAWLN